MPVCNWMTSRKISCQSTAIKWFFPPLAVPSLLAGQKKKKKKRYIYSSQSVLNLLAAIPVQKSIKVATCWFFSPYVTEACSYIGRSYCEWAACNWQILLLS